MIFTKIVVLLVENEQISKQLSIFNYILNLVINLTSNCFLLKQQQLKKEARHTMQHSEIITNIGLESHVVKQLNQNR